MGRTSTQQGRDICNERHAHTEAHAYSARDAPIQRDIHTEKNRVHIQTYPETDTHTPEKGRHTLKKRIAFRERMHTCIKRNKHAHTYWEKPIERHTDINRHEENLRGTH